VRRYGGSTATARVEGGVREFYVTIVLLQQLHV
jgi:hypothetical protein